MKILAVCSAGGHFSELTRITDNLNSEYFDIEIACEDRVYDQRINYSIPYSTRSNKIKYMFAFLNNLRLAFTHIKTAKPQVIISTGAHTAFFYFFIGKVFFKTRNIYVESFAKVNSPSLTYKISHRFIDENIVQHQNMQNVEANSHYYGGVY